MSRHPTRSLAVLAVLLAVAGVTPALAQPLSGGASGGGATQGGSGPPGSGTGVPGAAAKGTTRHGIGTSVTRGPHAGRLRRLRHHRGR